MIKYILILSLLFGTLTSCSNDEKADGYGNFEATEITISSEANGKLNFLNLEEGQHLKKGELIGLVDTTQLHLNKQQLIATKSTAASKSGGVWSQVKVLNQQLKNAKIEQDRFKKMF
ncbi:MAG TPA: biotin/lipoyl-binding protein, partial [Aequorivita sp.]|nr:biotin/lipoyl-binding protein [Aequorivita sp.]